jgi:hypothetical protein
MKRPLTAAESEFCHRLGLEIGFDDDDEDKHQFVHVCWPYDAYEGALCGSPRLWFHGGPFSNRPSLTGHEDIDCKGCLTQLARLRDANPQLLTIIGRLTDATSTLGTVARLARERLEVLALTRPEYEATVAAGWIEQPHEELHKALETDVARHRKYALEFAARRDAKTR